jgi:surface carbohydrate biosynthesis protein
MKRIYVVIENWKREVDSRIYFASKAVERGFEVYFANKYEIYSNLKNWESGILILKSFGPMNTKFIDEAIKRGHAVISWDEEMFLSTDLDELITRRVYLENLKKIEKFFLVGSREKKFIENKYPLYKEKLFATGHPRQEILKKNNNKIFDKDAELIKNKYGNFILFISSFNALNQLMADYQVDRYFGSLLKELDEVTLENYKKRLDFERINLEFVIKFLKLFSKKFPEKKIIIRPHPGEKINVWENICKELNNVECVFDHIPTNSWMKAADLSINSNCTTFFEAYGMKVKAINLFPAKGFDEMEFPILNTIAEKVTSLEKLFQIIESPENHVFYKSNINLDKYIENFDEKNCSVNKILDELLNYKNKKIIFRDNKINIFLKKCNFFVNQYFFRIIKNMINRFKKKSEYQTFEQKMIKQKLPPKIDYKDIKYKYDRLKKELNLTKTIKIRKYFKSLFIFSPKN